MQNQTQIHNQKNWKGIYGLYYQENNQENLFYVGYTVNARSRFLAHHQPSHLRKNTFKNNKIKKLLQNNQKAIMKEIEYLPEASQEELCLAEIKWIKYFKSQGIKLTNATCGGNGAPINHQNSLNHQDSPETCLLKSNLAKGNSYAVGQIISDQHKQAISKATLGKKRKINFQIAEEIRNLFKSGISKLDLIKKYEVCRTTIQKILLNKSYTNCPKNKKYKLSLEQIQEIKNLYFNNKISMKKLGARFNCSPQTICNYLKII